MAVHSASNILLETECRGVEPCNCTGVARRLDPLCVGTSALLGGWFPEHGTIASRKGLAAGAKELKKLGSACNLCSCSVDDGHLLRRYTGDVTGL